LVKLLDQTISLEVIGSRIYIFDLELAAHSIDQLVGKMFPLIR
ncbi:5294_t:CDS:1, partial [Gigaspora margarita]